VSIDFECHDHLIDQAFCSTKGYCCDGWDDPKLLSRDATVVTTTGAHLVEFGKNALDIAFSEARGRRGGAARVVCHRQSTRVRHVGHSKTELGRSETRTVCF
jgi:hypothetical protein